MFKLFRHIYEHAPLAIKWPAYWLPYSILGGRGYRSTVRACRELEFLSRTEVLRHQEQLLGQLLRFVVEQVPIYRPLRDVVEKHAPSAALKHFPFITKEDVRLRWGDLIPRCIDQIPHHVGTTSGSSGNPLTFLEDDSSYVREMGFIHSQWKRVGYRPSCRKATFRGVKFGTINDSCFWQHNPIHNELQFSPFHMNEATLGFYVEKLIEYRPSFLHGYPSAVDMLAEYVIRHRLESRLPPIRAALLGSEYCSQAQRERVGVAFRTRVYTWYGHSERTVLGGECECSPAYHMVPVYGVLEIIREDGEPCNIGERGEIVGTGFMNRSMPLIRYRTGDFATRESCECECGRHWDRFSNVLGQRSYEETLVGKHGSRISDAALNVHGDCFSNVVRYQYYQRIPGQLVIRVIPNPLYSHADEARIIAAHHAKLHGEMDITVLAVDEIALTPLGKQRRIVCDVNDSTI